MLLLPLYILNYMRWLTCSFFQVQQPPLKEDNSFSPTPLYKTLQTSNIQRQTNSLKVFQVIGVLVLGVSFNMWGNDLRSAV